MPVLAKRVGSNPSRWVECGDRCKDGVEIHASLCASESAGASGATSAWKARTHRWSVVVRGIIDSAADTSTSGAVRRISSESLTSWARDSYKTFLRSGGGRISICWRRMRMAFSRLTCQYACVRERGEGRPVVALRYDVVFASDTRGRSKSMDLRY